MSQIDTSDFADFLERYIAHARISKSNHLLDFQEEFERLKSGYSSLRQEINLRLSELIKEEAPYFNIFRIKFME